jgi:class 3 adenylate cyclase
MTLKIDPAHKLEAYAMIVDINNFSHMVRSCEVCTVAQDTRDTLYGAIAAIEAAGGEVIAFMGDAVLGLIEDEDQLFHACVQIAKDLDRVCEWISTSISQDDTSNYMLGGPSLKIAIEYGSFDVSTIESRFLGRHVLVIGEAINYASRISKIGEGNRCLLGPIAGKLMEKLYSGVKGPYKERIIGKENEGDYEYYCLKLDDIWREGPRGPGEESYLG